MSLDGSELRAVSSAERTLDPRTLAAMRSAGQRKARQRRIAQSSAPEISSGIVCFCGERFEEDRALEFMLHLRAEYGEVLEWQERVRRYWRQADHKRNSVPGKRASRNEKHNERVRERRADPALGGLITDLEREARHRWLSDPEKKAALAAKKKAYVAKRKLQADAICPICGNAYSQYSNGRPLTCSAKCGQQHRRLRAAASASEPTEIQDKRAEVVRLRAEGLTWDQVADRTGYANGSGALKAWHIAIKQKPVATGQ